MINGVIHCPTQPSTVLPEWQAPKPACFQDLTHSAPKDTYHRTTTPPHHLWQTKSAPVQGRVVFLPSSYLWKIITVLMRAADGSVTLRQDGMRVTTTKQGRRRSRRALCRISRGIRVHRGSFHFLQYESTENGQLLGKYRVCSLFPACNSVIRIIFMIEPIAPNIPPKGGRE